MSKPTDKPSVKSTVQYLSASMLADEREEFVVLDDGFVYYWPQVRSVTHSNGGTTTGIGAFSAAVLRELADELDRRNVAWQELIDNDPKLNT